jgi:hypothetical protein
MSSLHRPHPARRAAGRSAPVGIVAPLQQRLRHVGDEGGQGDALTLAQCLVRPGVVQAVDRLSLQAQQFLLQWQVLGGIFLVEFVAGSFPFLQAGAALADLVDERVETLLRGRQPGGAGRRRC